MYFYFIYLREIQKKINDIRKERKIKKFIYDDCDEKKDYAYMILRFEHSISICLTEKRRSLKVN